MTRYFLGPAWAAGEPLLVLALDGRRGVPRARDRRRTRHVVDDFGNAVAFERRCSGCLRWQPLDFGRFFATSQGSLGMSARCHDCNQLHQWMRHKRDPERWNADARRRYRERARRDPEWHRRYLDECAVRDEARKARDPEAWRAGNRAASRRWRARQAAIPERRRELLENARIDNALRSMDAGVELRSRRAAVERPLETVPCKPLAAVIYAQRDDLGLVCERLGIKPRTVRRWKAEEDGPSCRLSSADEVLTHLELCWWEVYDPERFPDLYTPERWREVVAEVAAIYEPLSAAA